MKLIYSDAALCCNVQAKHANLLTRRSSRVVHSLTTVHCAISPSAWRTCFWSLCNIDPGLLGLDYLSSRVSVHRILKQMEHLNFYRPHSEGWEEVMFELCLCVHREGAPYSEVQCGAYSDPPTVQGAPYRDLHWTVGYHTRGGQSRPPPTIQWGCLHLICVERSLSLQIHVSLERSPNFWEKVMC